ncbi:HAMP domain-containing protein [Sphaerisporangium album]|uniref:histidine kinase n=1 Tax=Sphaerisporangium album TaxID=509200 RepID=A0A367FMF3_9ACTN|nr:HAMP domain-containing sensor histidine kinase [Sphaerisporangium album]RCG31566.1 HAMP domain-containing protein [Sphaerisporangium album]
MAKPRRPALPSWTVRQRFTTLYAALFLMSGLVLLALTNVLAGTTVSRHVPGQDPPAQQPGLARAQERVHQLQAQLADLHAAQSRQLLMGSAIALVVMAVISVVLGKAVAGRVLRPLRTVTAATRRISAENLHERLAVPGPADEVKDLADTIDGLLERLEASFAAQRRFVANASHELRTPLTTMRASLDVAVAKPQPAPPQTLALADRLRTELDRVDSLLEGFLDLARAQHGALRGSVPVSLGDLASESLAAHAMDITEKDLTVEADTRDTAWTYGSPALLSRMVSNVIDNAVVHNRHGGRIRVATGTEGGSEGGSARLVVETGGPVLDPAQVARLTEPFQRLAADRTGSETGSGLGLSIVAAIADAHGGRLDLHARPEGGLRVTITLPRAPQAVTSAAEATVPPQTSTTGDIAPPQTSAARDIAPPQTSTAGDIAPPQTTATGDIAPPRTSAAEGGAE